MEKVLYFDYCALIILFILLISTLMRKRVFAKSNHSFLAMLGIGILTTFADIGAVHWDLLGSGNVVAKYIFHTLYLVLHSMLPAIYNIYILARTDTLYKLRQDKVQKNLLFLPIVIVIMMYIINCFWHIMFYLDEKTAYTRGVAFPFMYVVAIYYVIYGVLHLIKYRKTITRRRFIALLSLFPLTLIAVIIQFLFENLLVEMFANACGIVYISMIVQKPEERVDSETGLEKLSAYVEDVKRAFIVGKPIKIIMVNIANYSSIQEMLGYDGTIAFKQMIADKMVELDKKHKANADLYYMSNGKFRFVLSDHVQPTETIANQMNDFLKETVQIKQMDINIVPRVCIASCPEDIGDIDTVLAFGNDLNSKPYNGEVLMASQQFKKDYFDIMKDIDRIIEFALANHKFSVYYQPIYSVKENRFRSAEALLRLHDDKYGFISPDIFITAAEKSGAIYKVGEFVLEEVCKFISSERFKDLGLDYIEINLSVVQCMQTNLANQVLDMLKKYNVKPEQINLEITETAASYSQKTMLENLSILTQAGIRFALDDFGTGYSNMRRIASLPLYIVKLDKSFTDVEDNPRLMIVLKNTIKMIKAMNMQIVVEGVETENLAKQFSDLQCEYIQGYYYSKPVPQDDFVEFIEKSLIG